MYNMKAKYKYGEAAFEDYASLKSSLSTQKTAITQ